MTITRSPISIVCAISFLFGATYNSQDIIRLAFHTDAPKHLETTRIIGIFLKSAVTIVCITCACGLAVEARWSKSLASKLYLFMAIYCLLLPAFISIYVSLIRNVALTDILPDWNLQSIGFALIVLALRTMLLTLAPALKNEEE